MAELFTKVPHWLIRESDLDGNELLLYLALLSRADKKGICYPSVSRLAKESRMSASNVRRTRERLIARGLLKVTRRKTDTNRNDSNVYQVSLPKQQSVEFVESHEPVDNSRLNDRTDVFGTPFDLADGVTVEPPYSQGDSTDGVRVTGKEDPVKEDQMKKTLTVESPQFEFTDLGITEAQWWLLSDLYIHITGKPPTRQTQNEWGSLTSDSARDLIGRFYQNIERGDDYTGPEYGTPAYEALTDRGREWADAGMVPYNVIGDAA